MRIRSFATLAATSAAGILLAACAQDPVAPQPRPSSQPAFGLVIGGGEVVLDSVVVASGPVALQAGSANVPVQAYVSPAASAEGLAVDFDCGNNQISSGSVTNGIATTTCTYTAAGVYPVSGTLNGTTKTANAYVVTYDPNGSFVTGGGFIQSPQGAYVANPGAVGKANFGFVAKYLPGRAQPDGETEFQIKAGGLNFHGKAYEWLVISGAKAQFQGTGTVNGGGSYNFRVTIIDGDRLSVKQADTFRIRIVDRVSGSVVYDNQLGQDELSDAGSVLTGGSINIKK